VRGSTKPNVSNRIKKAERSKFKQDDLKAQNFSILGCRNSSPAWQPHWPGSWPWHSDIDRWMVSPGLSTPSSCCDRNGTFILPRQKICPHMNAAGGLAFHMPWTHSMFGRARHSAALTRNESHYRGYQLRVVQLDVTTKCSFWLNIFRWSDVCRLCYSRPNKTRETAK
jgi:hypothetical protein